MKAQKEKTLAGRYVGATCAVASLSVFTFYASRALISIRAATQAHTEQSACASELGESCPCRPDFTLDDLFKSIHTQDIDTLESQLKSSDVNWKDDFGNTLLMEAAGLGDVCMVRLLLDRGADPGVVDEYGNDALSLARQNSHREVAALITQAVVQDGA